MKYYELWDSETGNLVTASASRAEVLAYVRRMMIAHGPGVVEPWGLLWDDDADERAGGLVAEGSALAALALTQTTTA